IDFAGKLARGRPDFVYLTPVPTGIGFLRDVPFIVLAKLTGRPVILHLHGRGIAERSRHRVWRALYRWVLSGCAIVNASDGMRRTELSPLALRRTRTYVVANAVAQACTSARDERDAIARPRLLFLSSTFPAKGVFVLLDAVSDLVARGGDVDLEI